jgi:hypothetical protein
MIVILGVMVAVIKQRQLPKLVLMASLVTLQAQAALVSPNQEEWLWKDLPVIQNNQPSAQEQAHENNGSGSSIAHTLMNYGMGYLAGRSSGNHNSGNNNTGNNSANNYTPPSKPNPDTSHWYSNNSKNTSPVGSSPSANKGYSLGGFGASASKGGYSSGSSGG